MHIIGALLELLFILCGVALPVWFGVYVVRSLRDIKVSLQQIAEGTKSRGTRRAGS